MEINKLQTSNLKIFCFFDVAVVVVGFLGSYYFHWNVDILSLLYPFPHLAVEKKRKQFLATGNNSPIHRTTLLRLVLFALRVIIFSVFRFSCLFHTLSMAIHSTVIFFLTGLRDHKLLFNGIYEKVPPANSLLWASNICPSSMTRYDVLHMSKVENHCHPWILNIALDLLMSLKVMLSKI